MRIENATSAIILQQGADTAAAEPETVQQEVTASAPAQESAAAISSSSQNLVSSTNLLIAQTDMETADSATETTDALAGASILIPDLPPGPPAPRIEDGIDLMGIAAFLWPEPDQEIAAEDAWLYQMPSAAESTARLQMVKGLMAAGMTSEDARDVLRSVLNSGQSAEQYLRSQASTTTTAASSVTATPTVETVDTTPSVTISA